MWASSLSLDVLAFNATFLSDKIGNFLSRTFIISIVSNTILAKPIGVLSKYGFTAVELAHF